MTKEFRWSISELIARYTLEPQLSDVFVEGQYDVEVLSRSHSALKSSRSFYEVDVVDVPNDLLSKYGLTSGNKQRVQALANELAELPPEASVLCLVDRDLDHWFTELTNTSRLKWSIYSCIESHFITDSVISEILLTTSRAKIVNLNDYVCSIVITLKALYALRLADRELSLHLSWVDLSKYLKRVGCRIEFDAEKYIFATLGKNSKLRQIEQFTQLYSKWLKKLTCDVKLASRGHDYTELLAWSVSAFSGEKSFATQGAIERLLVLMAPLITSLHGEAP